MEEKIKGIKPKIVVQLTLSVSDINEKLLA